jgi:XRE family transcriptional regulator|nr:MAG TPA: Repressor protein CI [Caudoviricetes sp.]
MNVLGTVIKELRKNKKMTQKELSKLTGFKQNTISNHENGKRSLDEDDIQIYAQALNVSPQYLFNKLNNKEVTTQYPLLSQITDTAAKLHEPRQKKVLSFTQDQLDEQEGNSINNILSYSDFTCYGAVSAGTGEWLGEEYKEEVTLPASIVPNQAFDFVLRVNGNSMEPLFKDNEYIFVRKTEDIRNGQIGVFVVDGEAYLKKAYLEKDCLRLVSLNKDYEDLLFNGQNDIKLVGVVVI